MMGGEEHGRGGGLMGWAQDARVRSAACAAQAVLAAESAAAIGERVDRGIERTAERNPEYAEHLQAIIATAAGRRAAIAEWKRSRAAGRPGQLRDMAAVQDRDRAAGELQDQVTQGSSRPG